MTCNSCNSCNEQNQEIRFVHNVVGGPNVNIYLGKTILAQNLSYGEYTSYLSVNSGKNVLIVKAGDSKVISQEIYIKDDTNHTVIIGGDIKKAETLKAFVYIDKSGCAKKGYGDIRFIHSVFGAPNVDVYSGDTKVFSDVAYGQVGTPKYLSVKLGENAGSPQSPLLQISVFVAGTQNKVAGPLPVYVVSGGIYTIIAIGNLNDSVIGAIVSHDNESQNMNECEVLQDDFDAQKYTGKWYQIADIPQYYETNCIRSVAEYTLLSKNLKVVNTCYDKNWNVISTIVGSATATNPCIPAALTVIFPDAQPFEPLGPNYLVHSTDYISYAIVGSPTRSSYYILSRASKMSVSEYKKFVKYAEKLGYNSSLIKPNYHALKSN